MFTPINPRKRIQLNASEPKITDQSGKKQCDINNIMAQYAKTGMFTHLSKSVSQYIDNTLVIPLEDAHQIMSDAKDLFNQLPAQIRKLMDNNPQNLNTFISDPNNQDILIKHGLLTLRKAKITDEGGKPPSQPPGKVKKAVKKESDDSEKDD